MSQMPNQPWAVEKDAVLDAFAEIFRKAAQEVPSDYMQLPRHPTSDTDSGVILLERVYCYELYHQLRLLLQQRQSGPLPHAVARGWRLNAEVAKKTSYIPVDWIPDFIWHLPGQPQNGHVIEVKRASETLSRITEDVEKLVGFREKAQYERATLLVVGSHNRERGYFEGLIRAAARAEIELLFHQHPGVRPSSRFEG